MMEFECEKCHARVGWDEFDDNSQQCMYCVFPEATKSRPVELNKDLGYDRNQTEMGYVMENLSDIPSHKREYPFTPDDMKTLKKIKKGKKRKDL